MSASPDLVILNGSVITFDLSRPRATAVAVRDGLILAVGETDSIRGMAGPGTRVIDAQGGTVLPGFIDSHVHLFGGSVELDYLDLGGLTGVDAVTDAVRARAAADPKARLIFAVQADYGMFGPVTAPRGTISTAFCPTVPSRCSPRITIRSGPIPARSNSRGFLRAGRPRSAPRS